MDTAFRTRRGTWDGSIAGLERRGDGGGDALFVADDSEGVGYSLVAFSADYPQSIVGNMLRHCTKRYRYCARASCAIGTMHHSHREICFSYSGSGLVVYNGLVTGLLRLSLLIAH